VLQKDLGTPLGATASKKLRAKVATVASVVRLPLPTDGKCNKTPMIKRWVTAPSRSYITTADARFATEDDCLRIEAELWAQIAEFDGMPPPSARTIACAEEVLGRPLVVGAGRCIRSNEPLTLASLKVAAGLATQQVGTAELPIEYRVDLRAGGRHRPGNLAWTRTPTDLVALRALLAANGVPKKLLGKVQVKAHATDKVTMPPHFSNRDYRWATWVNSGQFAARTECYAVELELLSQILEFEGAPIIDAARRTEVEQHLGRPLAIGARRCLITGVPMKYADFIVATTNPAAGKSPYHVGHLSPLTRGGKHEQSNVVWMTEQGNRIQGNDTLDEIVSLLKIAAQYHVNQGR
jgi:hypothetical protein